MLHLGKLCPVRNKKITKGFYSSLRLIGRLFFGQFLVQNFGVKNFGNKTSWEKCIENFCGKKLAEKLFWRKKI